jgi:filamentous hemagglutinin family protein
MKTPLLYLLLIFSLSVPAQITTDGTLGPAQNLPGSNYRIEAYLGQQRGDNLFHSFRDFNLQSWESATFFGPNHIQNVISRVTGGNPSHIDGLFRSTIPGADVYFLNPYGIMFGPNARLDVPGSFHASTADYLRFSDGGRFNARNPRDTILTVAPIESFGFLTNSPAPLSIEGSQLEISQGKIFSLIGGNISITSAQIKAPAGRINLASVAEMGDVIPKVEDFVVPSLRGDMTISENSLIETSGEGGGGIFIRGGQIIVEESDLKAHTLGNQDGEQIDIQGINIALSQGAQISSQTKASGSSANINLQALDSITITGEEDVPKDSLLSQSSETGGNAGPIQLQAKNITITDNTLESKTQGTGQGGDLIFEAQESVNLKNTDIYINSESQKASAGQAGNLSIKANQIVIQGGIINGGVFGQGNAGNITLEANGNISLIGNIHLYADAFLGRGHAGNITLIGHDISLLEGSFIDATAKNYAGNAGNISVKATGTVTIAGASHDDGKGRISAIKAGSFPLSEGIPGGHGGTIEIEAQNLVLNAGGQIINSTIASEGWQSGHAGEILIQVTGETKLSGVNPYGENQEGFGSGIYARAIGVNNNTGDGGKITLKTGSLVIERGAAIETDTNTQARGGDIQIVALGDVHISGDATNEILNPPASTQLQYLLNFNSENYNQSTSGIYARSEGTDNQTGTSGSITLSAKKLTLVDNASLSTSSYGGGQAGDIRILVEQLQLDKNASISSESQFANVITVANTAERDTQIITAGNIIEVADIGNSKMAHYVHTGALMTRINEKYQVANLTELTELPNHYQLNEGDMVEVLDRGDGKLGRYLYIDLYNFVQKWILIEDSKTSIHFETMQALFEIGGWFDNVEQFPSYSDGQIITVADAGNGKPATFVYATSIDPFNGYVFGETIRLSVFDIESEFELQALPKQQLVQNGDLANLKVANTDDILSRFIYNDGQWIQLNQVRYLANPAEMNALTVAQVGHVVEMANSDSSSKTRMIYTGQDWIPLNPKRQTVQTWSELNQLTATAGDIVAVTDAGAGQMEHFFYANGQWLKQARGGYAGTINLTISDKIRLHQKSTITTEAVSAGGGAIRIHANGFVLLQDSQISTSVQEGSGNGGDMKLSPKFIILKNGQIIARANEGQGGNINITTTGIYTFPPKSASSIDASSNLGIDGEVNIDSPTVDLDAMLVVLPGGHIEAQLKNCNIAEELDNPNTFTVKPRHRSPPLMK